MILDYIHHTMIYLCRYSNCGLSNGFSWCWLVFHLFWCTIIFEVSRLIQSLKLFHLMERCFVCGLYFGYFDNSIATLLSSIVVVYELHESNFIPNTLDTSYIFCLSGIKSLMLWLRLMYLASVVDKNIFVWILLTQKIGQFASLIIYLVLDKTYQTLSMSSLHHDPAKFASA